MHSRLNPDGLSSHYRNITQNQHSMEIKLKPEYRMIRELHGRIGNWIYRTRKKANGETKIFAHYSPRKDYDPNPKWGKLFED